MRVSRDSGVLFVLFDMARKLGVQAGSIYNARKMDQAEATRTLVHCKEWAREVIEAIADAQLQTRGQALVIEKIHSFIDAHLCEEFSREDIAGHVHLNPVYLSRMYKKETGVSLTDCIQDKRMELAKKHLIETPYKITTIMEMIGYQSPSHFTQLFKKAFKMTPQEFRKYHRGP